MNGMVSLCNIGLRSYWVNTPAVLLQKVVCLSAFPVIEFMLHCLGMKYPQVVTGFNHGYLIKIRELYSLILENHEESQPIKFLFDDC